MDAAEQRAEAAAAAWAAAKGTYLDGLDAEVDQLEAERVEAEDNGIECDAQQDLVDSCEATYDEWIGTVERLATDLENLNEQLVPLNDQYSMLTTELENARREGLEQLVGDLEGQLEILDAQIEPLEREWGDVHGEYHAAIAQRDAAAIALGDARTELATCERTTADGIARRIDSLQSTGDRIGAESGDPQSYPLEIRQQLQNANQSGEDLERFTTNFLEALGDFFDHCKDRALQLYGSDYYDVQP